MMLPASSLINEKQKRTLEAIYVTPATLGDIFWAKGALGAVLALFMGTVTLAISGYGGGLVALLPPLAMGAVLAAEIGLLAGAYIQDMNTLYAAWKFGGILLFGPAVVFMFPGIPQWIGYIFPTYYVIRPVVDIGVSGASLGAEALYLGILAGLVCLGALAVSGVVRRLSTQALRLNA
jgi:ABC-2 type transport system permease protein